MTEEIEKQLFDEIGVAVEVTCPKLEKDSVTECSAKGPGGESFRVEVRMGDDGEWEGETQGVAIGRKVAAKIKEFYAKDEFDLPLDEVTCPPLIPQQDSVRVVCTGTVQGVEIAFELKLSKDGTDFEPKRGVVLGAGAEKLMVDTFAKQGIQIQADCGPRLRASVPGSTFTCTARDAQGQTLPVYFRVTGNDGQVDMNTEPFGDAPQ